jgi:hypothetical protein
VIEIIKNAINKDGVPVTFPADSSGRNSVMLVGLKTDDESMAPVRLSAAGKLMVDSTVTVGEINIGEVGLVAQDSAGVVGVVNRQQNAGLPITSSLMTIDPRLNFSAVGANPKVLSMGNNAGNDVPLSVDALGKLNVVVSSAPVTPVTAADSTYAAQTLLTEDAYVDLLTMVTAKFIKKTITAKNAGVTNAAEIKIIGSIDGGGTYDVPVVANIELAAGITLVFTHDTPVTNLKVQIRAKTAGNHTTVTSKAYAIGA